MPRTSGRLQNKALKHPIKEEVAEGTSSEDDADGDKTPDRLYEVVLKRELNIKEEIEDPQETGQEADEFSGYEYLLDQITVSSQHVKTELNESSEENDDEDQDSDVADEDDAADDDDEDEEDEDEEDEDEEDDDEDVDDPDYDTKSTRRKTQNDSSEFSCFYCDFTCKLKSDFGAHLKSHKDLTVHKCGLCKATFDKMKALEIHRLAKHPTDNINKHVCKCCQKKFATKKKLHRHIQNVHKDEKAYKCKHCPKKFARKGGLDQHMSFHQDLRPFECKVCHGKFRTKANKDLHMKAHFGIKEYKCDECGKEFLRKDELKKHLISVHENKFTYSCSICNKSIKGHVLSHLRIHMKEKNHKCKECGKKFVQSSQLKVHMRMHTGVKPFQCEVCKATFAHGISLKTHMFTHTGEKPVKCQLCPAAFTQMPHLRKHMLTIHKSDKPYVCAPCHKFFKAKADLTHHLSEKACAASGKKLKKGAAS